VGGGIVLIAYRPGGPIDLLVGVSASLPLLVSAAAIVWPPLVRGYRGLAAVFWLGLLAGLLLIPSILGVIPQVVSAGTEPLLPSAEIVYPWALALLATSLFAGLGLTREVYSEAALSRRRVAASTAFAVVTSAVVGCVFAAASLADEAALRDRPAAYSRFGPTAVDVVLPSCDGTIRQAGTAEVEFDVWGDVDGHSIGRVELGGLRSGADETWTADVRSGGSTARRGSVVVGSSAWTLDSEGDWQRAATAELNGYLMDASLLAAVLAPGNRAAAEDRGIEVVEGARARRCRIAVDGDTFKTSIPELAWLTGDADLHTWRGEMDYWIFGDGEVGKAYGWVNGPAQGILPGLLATVYVDMTATDRDAAVSISAPGSTASSQD
jgi:hypothetical protein